MQRRPIQQHPYQQQVYMNFSPQMSHPAQQQNMVLPLQMPQQNQQRQVVPNSCRGMRMKIIRPNFHDLHGDAACSWQRMPNASTNYHHYLYRCPYCEDLNIVGVKPRNLEPHVKKHHPGKKIFECYYCSYSAGRYVNVQNHTARHCPHK